MKISLKDFVAWLTMVANIALVVWFVPTLLYSWKIIPAMELVVMSYKLVAVSSIFVIILTLLQWIKKYPIPVTWLQTAFGITAITTLAQSSIILMRIYKSDTFSNNVIAGIISSPVAPLTVLAVFLSIRAYQKGFEF